MRSRSVPLLVLCSWLALQGVASAQSVTMGSPLTVAPNVDWGCEAQPAIADVNGNFGLFASNAPDCTWRQSGVFGVTSGDTRFSSVPGTGTITSVSVRSGPTPAPLRFVIFRTLSTPGFGGEAQCCFYVGESDPVQPQPNTVTTFQTNIPVTRDTINGFLAADLFGISAASNTGALPLFIPGQPNAFNLTTPGSVNAGFFYPRLGTNPNDSGGGRREDGIPGVELTVQWTWCPAGQTCGAGGGGGGGGGGATGPAVRNQGAQVARGRAPIDLVCNGNAVCRGLLELVANAGATAAGNKKTPTFGKKRFELQPGATGIVDVKLKGKAKKQVKKTGSYPVTARLTPDGGSPVTFSVTLSR
jgi:hypothetical protein